MHYVRWKKSGDPLVVIGRRIRPEPERFWLKVNKDGPVPTHRPDLGPCWLWTAAESRGYGHFTLADGGYMGAHRWSYTHMVGPIPEGLTLDHLCRVRSCVNPSHLEPCPALENYLRGVTGGHQNRLKTHCPQGHPYDEANTYHHVDPKTGRTGRRCRECVRASNRRQNEKRRLERGTSGRRTHCPKGHEYTDENTFLEKRFDRPVRRCIDCLRARAV